MAGIVWYWMYGLATGQVQEGPPSVKLAATFSHRETGRHLHTNEKEQTKIKITWIQNDGPNQKLN